MSKLLRGKPAPERRASPSPRRGRRPRVEGPTPTREQVVAAVIAMAERDGEGSINMRSLANELGVSPRFLYLLVESKDELYSLAADALLAQWTIPSKGTWQERFAIIARTGFRLARRFPELTRRSMQHSLEDEYPPNSARILQAIRDCLLEAGLASRAATRMQLVYNSLLLGSLEMARSAAGIRDPKLHRELDAAFETGLQHLIAGIQATARQKS